MDPDNPLHQDVVLVNELGLHARSAAQIARIARQAKGRVWILRRGERADATSVLDLLTLASPQGSPLRISVEDPADRPVLEALARLVESGFEEGPP
ncbi:MAG: HPr family phosphocarrier protein [Desulfobacterales bacterium]